MEMKSKFVQLCVGASTWSIVSILRLGRIQAKGEIARNCDWNMSCEDRRNFGDQKTDVHKKLCSLPVD